MSCHVMSCHIMSCHVTSRHVTSCHIISYIISYYIIVYHITNVRLPPTTQTVHVAVTESIVFCLGYPCTCINLPAMKLHFTTVYCVTSQGYKQSKTCS